MQNKTSNIGQEEEIDLVAFFSKIWNIFIKRIKLFLVFIFVGIGLAVAYYKLSTPVYKSRMIISSTVFPGPSFVIILENLMQLIREGNSQELAIALNMDVPTVEKIRKLELYSSKKYAQIEFSDKVTFEDKKNLMPTEEKAEQFVIVAYVVDKNIYSKIEQGILYYLNNSPYIKSSGQMKKSALNRMKANVEKQMKSLDSLQSSIASQLSTNGLGKDFFIGEPSSMYRDMIDLYNVEVRIREALVDSNINIVESFRIYNKPHSPKLMLSLAVALPVAFLLFLVTVVILESKNRVQQA